MRRRLLLLPSFILIPLLILISHCTSLISIEKNFVKNYTNITITTNIVKKTIPEIQIISNIIEPYPNNLLVYVYTNALLSSWGTNTKLHWWDNEGNAGDVPLYTQQNQFFIFVISNIDVRKPFGIKLYDGGVNWEPIKSGYDRWIVYDTNLTEELTLVNSITGTNELREPIVVTNYYVRYVKRYKEIFVLSPQNWWESYTYFYISETNLYIDPPTPGPAGGYVTDWFGAEYKGNGITYFTFYAPNVRRVWVAGDFSNWKKIPMYISKDRVWWWVVLSNTEPGQAYKFVIERVDRDLRIRQHWVSDPASKKNYHSPTFNSLGGESYIVDHSSFVWQDSNWWNFSTNPFNDGGTLLDDLIIYQLHIRTFNTQGPGDYYGWGTFQTLINKLDYITNLGFTAIEPLPIMEFAGDQSWGYNYVLFYAPESVYIGTNLKTVEPLKRLVNEAHKRNLAVILDLVFNHMGTGDDVVWQIDPPRDPSNPDTYWYGGNTAWGPSFNYANPLIRKFLIDSAKYYIIHYHIDGFRFDYTDWIKNWGGSGEGWNFLRELTSSLKAVRPQVVLIAEQLPNDGWITRSLGNGGAGFDSQWSVDLPHHFKPNYFQVGDASYLDINYIANRIQLQYLYNAGAEGNWVGVQYMESHDEVANGKQRNMADLRSSGASFYGAQWKNITSLATILMAKGIPMIFMGQEVMQGWDDDDAKWFNDYQPQVDWNNTNLVDGTVYRVREQLKALRDLIRIRRNNEGIQWEYINVFHINDVNDVIAFTRGLGNDIFVVINYAKTSYSSYNISGFPTSGTYDCIYASPSGAYGESWADAYITGSFSATSGGTITIKIPEYGVLIYKKR